MVESNDTDKPKRDAVCDRCGKAVGAAVSGSDGQWSFKPVCRCASGQSSKTETAGEQPETLDDGKSEGKSNEPGPQATNDREDELKPDSTTSETEPNPNSDSVFVKSDSVSDVDSGGWASVNSAKTANGPDLSKPSKSKSSGSGSWTNTPAPKSFKDKGNLSSGDSHESWISVGGSDDLAEPVIARSEAFGGPVADDFSRPVAHEIGKVSSSSSGGISTSSSSSGTNLGVTYSSGSNVGGASAAYRRSKGSSKAVEEPVDWVPVKPKPVDKSKSQFADDAELLDLTHKTETAEEKTRPATRKAIQDALRRTRIKMMVVAVIAVVLGYGIYSYANTTGVIKKLGILNPTSNFFQQSKKGSVRHSKKAKRAK